MVPSEEVCNVESSPAAQALAPCHPQRRRWSTAVLALALGLCAMGGAASASAQTETLVFVRHGEKPEKGYGQLDCQGLNRALALPAVIAAKFGKPYAIYAPNPSMQKQDGGVLYDYVRPLATIEPTAIQFGMPVNTGYGYSHIDALEHALVKPEYAGKLILIAWEHRKIEALVRNILGKHGGSPQSVRDWKSDDFDSIYIVKLDWGPHGGRPQSEVQRATFALDQEGLNGRGTDCPCAALPDAPSAPSQ